MSVITLPSTLNFGQWSFGQVSYGVSSSSPSTGASVDRSFGPPRWTISAASPEGMDLSQAGAWEAVVLKLRGSVNYLLAWDIARPQPEGTMRGTPTLASSVAAGAVSIVLTGVTSGDTLLTGDWLQIGAGLGTSQLVKVMANATASATLTVTFEPPIRLGLSFASGTAVTWDKASSYFKRATARTAWRSAPGSLLVGGHTLDLLEQFG